MKHFAILGALLFIAGCASSPKEPPEWVDNPEVQYPQARFLIGLGQADSAAVARDRARSDLVKVFEARISEESQDSSKARRSAGGGKVWQSSEFTAERHVNVTTSQVVEGVRIAETWNDRTHGTYQALAVLDRFQTGERLRAEIMQLDDLAGLEVANAKSAGELFAQMNSAAKALGAQRRRDVLQRELRIVDPTGVGIPARYDSARLESNLDQLARRLRLIPEVKGDPIGNLGSILAGAIVHVGFTPAKKGDPDAYRIVGDLDLDESESDGWHWARGLLQIKVVDAQGEIRSSHQWNIKESALQPAVARQRAMGEVDRVLRNQLREAVLGGVAQ